MSATVVRSYRVACPICGGCGTVPPDFYSRLGASTSTAREICKTCLGAGTTWATESVVSSSGFFGAAASHGTGETDE